MFVEFPISSVRRGPFNTQLMFECEIWKAFFLLWFLSTVASPVGDKTLVIIAIFVLIASYRFYFEDFQYVVQFGDQF